LKIYQVGGAVRDRLLGLPVHDIDYVVVGSTVEEMLAKGYRPVGNYFPVFLHPVTNHEYALARTERKTAAGHKGFVFHADPNISLEQDLLRRDLSINAIAQEVNENGDLVGQIIDPYEGIKDLQQGLFRHLSNAFIEDPLRVLRVARFAATFPTFSISPETLSLMGAMVQSGDLETLSKERIWQEFARAFEAKDPQQFIEVLDQCHALSFIFPKGFVELWHDKQGHQDIQRNLRVIVDASSKIEDRLACLFKDVSKAELKDWAKEIRVPNDIADFCLIASDFEFSRRNIQAVPMLDFFHRADIWRKPNRFKDILKLFQNLGIDIALWEKVFDRLMEIDSGAVAGEVAKRSSSSDLGQMIQNELQTARLRVIEKALSQ
jgi:tRNA nucleotidyltransferase (CCA-adding enzyme)